MPLARSVRQFAKSLRDIQYMKWYVGNYKDKEYYQPFFYSLYINLYFLTENEEM